MLETSSDVVQYWTLRSDAGPFRLNHLAFPNQPTGRPYSFPSDFSQSSLNCRFSVGVENEDGSISLWLNCHRQTPLKYFQEIPADVLFAIENPLSEHNNFRQVEVALPATPPRAPPRARGVVQESPTLPSVKPPHRAPVAVVSSVRPNYRPMVAASPAIIIGESYRQIL